MRKFKVLQKGRNSDFYLVQEGVTHHVLEIYAELEINDTIIETDSFEYLCNDEKIIAIPQWEGISLERGQEILSSNS